MLFCSPLSFFPSPACLHSILIFVVIINFVVVCLRYFSLFSNFFFFQMIFSTFFFHRVEVCFLFNFDFSFHTRFWHAFPLSKTYAILIHLFLFSDVFFPTDLFLLFFFLRFAVVSVRICRMVANHAITSFSMDTGQNKTTTNPIHVHV